MGVAVGDAVAASGCVAVGDGVPAGGGVWVTGAVRGGAEVAVLWPLVVPSQATSDSTTAVRRRERGRAAGDADDEGDRFARAPGLAVARLQSDRVEAELTLGGRGRSGEKSRREDEEDHRNQP